VSAGTPAAERTEALASAGIEINCLFAVDLFNEGVDLPQVDTVLFLRPTQSATVFLQQLGRGLRRAHRQGGAHRARLLGQHRREFRFDVRLPALTGASWRALLDDLEHGFPFLPSGSQLVLDRVARTIVLENVRQQLKPGSVPWSTTSGRTATVRLPSSCASPAASSRTCTRSAGR
jgi:hypothetical protein